MTVQVARLGVADATAAGELLAVSHADYPAFRRLFPDAGVRSRVLRLFMTATARDAARQGAALLARDGQRIRGVALWMPPGTFPLSPVRKARMGSPLLRVALAAPRSFPAFARVGTRLEHDLDRETAWYLQAMGVHPRAQRQGIGRRLLAPALEAADRTEMVCRLHTSDAANVEYYRRHGFKTDGPAIELSAAGPRYIAMTRPPAKHRNSPP